MLKLKGEVIRYPDDGPQCGSVSDERGPMLMPGHLGIFRPTVLPQYIFRQCGGKYDGEDTEQSEHTRIQLILNLFLRPFCDQFLIFLCYYLHGFK